MFVVVADEVAQTETVVGGDEVDAAGWPATAQTIEVTAPAQPVRKLRELTGVAFPEFSNVVAIFAVPLTPQNGQVANLIAEIANVPRFGDQLHARQCRVLVNDVEERCAGIVGLRLAT